MNRKFLLCLPAFMLAFLLSCHKHSDPLFTHLLGNEFTNNPVKIGQALEIYDSTSLHDSLLFVFPPTDRTYRWSVGVDSDQAVLSDDYLHGRAQVIFKTAGAHPVWAAIFDSASNREIARTNTLTIQVNPDTLTFSTAIAADDQLSISCYSFSPSANVDAYSFMLDFETTHQYLLGSVIPYHAASGAGFTVSFADSTNLPAFPFDTYNGMTAPLQTYISMSGLQVGASQPFTVVWLGVTYTGTVSRPDADDLAFTWDANQPVKIVHGGSIQ